MVRSRGIPNIIPDRMFCKLRWYQWQAWTTGAATYTTYAYRINSIYDPYYPVGGGSCTGYPQLAELYGMYRVLGAKIKIWAYNTCNSPIVVMVQARTATGVTPTSSAEILNLGHESGTNVRMKRVLPYVSGNGLPQTRLSMYRSMKRLCGITAKTDNDYAGIMGSNPVSQAFFDVCLCGLAGSETQVTANINIQIVYYVQCFEKHVPYAN